MVTWAMVLETAIKWLIPVLCVAIVGLITAHFVKPFKKGNAAAKQEEWDALFDASTHPKTMGDAEWQSVKQSLFEVSAGADKEILEKIDKLSTSIEEQNKVNTAYHERVDKSIDLIQQGVQDAHLQNLICTCQTYIRRGYITTAEFETYQQRYKLYKDLGGNGHMEPWNAKICALPNEPKVSTPPPTETSARSTLSSLPKTHK